MDEEKPIVDKTSDYEDVTDVEDFVDNEIDDVQGKSIDEFRNSWDDDPPTGQETIETVHAKYRTEAEVPKSQKKSFDDYRGAYGRHVALSNTRRSDNPRHLMAIDLQSIWERIPTHAQRATLIRIRETSEFQMCRGNEEKGGFEAKLSATNIRREDVDVKQSQSLIRDNGGKKKKGILNFLRK